ncbi:hypothetical protein EMGBS1_04520 [Chloroflexota bacterium]|nr:hypothetical protein EMGBS1_04520 [Chloroflexota bacterium]
MMGVGDGCAVGALLAAAACGVAAASSYEARAAASLTAGVATAGWLAARGKVSELRNKKSRVAPRSWSHSQYSRNDVVGLACNPPAVNTSTASAARPASQRTNCLRRRCSWPPAPRRYCTRAIISPVILGPV